MFPDEINELKIWKNQWEKSWLERFRDKRKQKNIEYSRSYLKREYTILWYFQNRVDWILLRRELHPDIFFEEVSKLRNAKTITDETKSSVSKPLH